jgi:hypothetical protein
LISGADAGLGVGGGKNYFSAVRFSFEVREREAVRDYVQRLGSQVGKRSDEERTIRSTEVAELGWGWVVGRFKKFVEMFLYLLDRICF